MKKSIVLCVGCLSLIVVLSACGGGGDDDKYNCNEVCARVGECDGVEAKAECEVMCPAFKAIMRSSAYEVLGECMMTTDCSNFDSDVCFALAAVSVPASVTDDFVDTLCDKLVECDPEEVKEECVEGVESEIADILIVLRLVNDATLGCLEDCMDAVDCPVSELDLGTCMALCKIPMID